MLIDFLVHRFPAVARNEWIARMSRGDVVSEQGVALSPDAPYRAYDKVYYYRSLRTEAAIPFEETVLYQDDYLVAVDKPHFLPVTPSGRYLQETLLVRLKRKLGIDTLAPMHRLDRETAGITLFTVQPSTRNLFQSLFRQRVVKKYYEAIAPLRRELVFPITYRSRIVESSSFMIMHEVAGEPNAETRIELLESDGRHAHYGLHPVTGQKHQLRVQMAALGMPILNDQIYPLHLPEQHGSDMLEHFDKPLQLLAKSISFTDPVTGEQRCFESRYSLHL